MTNPTMTNTKNTMKNARTTIARMPARSVTRQKLADGLRPVKQAVIGAARNMTEQLERRVYLSVARDSAGFTVVTPSDDPAISRVIYVSSSTGNDANDGRSPNSARRTIVNSRSLLRDRSGDQLLLKRGDTFNESIRNWNLSGYSADNPIVIGTWGTSPARPVLKTGTSTDGFSTPTLASSTVPLLSNVVLQGISFEANLRNVDGPDYIPDAAGGQYGFRSLGKVDGFLVEDCSFDSYQNNVVAQTFGSPGFGKVSNFTLRRSTLIDAYNETSTNFGPNTKVTSQGAYFAGIDHLRIEDNLFDHNGWSETLPVSGANIYSHNIYITADSRNVAVTGNIIANAASHGLQMRAGGVVRDNLFLNNPIAVSFGLVNGSDPTVGGVTGEVVGNVVVGSRDISGDRRGYGVELGNIAGAVVTDNIFSNYPNNGSAAIRLDTSSNTSELHAVEVGINNLTVARNIVYGWTRGIALSQFLVSGGTGYTALNNLTVADNQFQQNGDTVIAEHNNIYRSETEDWHGNTYELPPYPKPFKFRTASMTAAFVATFDAWKANIETTAVAGTISYFDPGRDVARYNSTVDGTNSVDAYLKNVRQQSSGNYRISYAATAVNAYVKAGYALNAPEEVPAVVTTPVARLSVDDVTLTDEPTHELVVTYTSPAGVDVTTIDDADLRVIGPGGFDVTATLATPVEPQEPGSTGAIIVVYQIAAPAGGWRNANVGTYQVYINNGAVTAGDGSAVPGGLLGTFDVRIDVSGPLAVGYRSDITIASTQPGTNSFVANFYDPSGVPADALDGQDFKIVRVSGTGSYLPFESTAVLSSVVITEGGKGANGTYRFNTPATGWKSYHNGTYDIVMQAEQVADGLGNFVPVGRIGSFKVAVETTAPTVSVAPVTPALRRTPVGTVAINFNEYVEGFDTADLTLTRDGQTVDLSSATLTSSNSINYILSGLDEATSPAGRYTLTIASAGTGIVDKAANVIKAGASALWTVDLTPPTATVTRTAPDALAPHGRVIVTFNEPVSGFDSSDLALLTNNGTEINLSGVTISSADNMTYEVAGVNELAKVAGTYTLTLVANGSGIADAAGNALMSGGEAQWQAYALVAGRFIFYNGSAFDGKSTAANSADDGAIATDKAALLPGARATSVNYTSYDRGINGVMIDVTGLPGGTLDPAVDFQFRTGNSNNTANWVAPLTPPTITVRPGAGTNGSDRVTIIWPDGTIKKQWLQIKLLPTAATGLATADVFYFGNAVGESLNSATDATVGNADVIGPRDHGTSFVQRVGVTNAYDYNRDKQVNNADLYLAFYNQTSFVSSLRLITV